MDADQQNDDDDQVVNNQKDRPVIARTDKLILTKRTARRTMRDERKEQSHPKAVESGKKKKVQFQDSDYEHDSNDEDSI